MKHKPTKKISLKDKYDLQTITEYEKLEKEGKIRYKSFDKTVDDLGLEDEI